MNGSEIIWAAIDKMRPYYKLIELVNLAEGFLLLQRQADQPQAADPEEPTEDNLDELEDLTMDEPITAESLKRSYRDAFTGPLN